MKVALVYDRVNKWGGAERVLLALNELFPHAPLFTSVYNPKTASWAEVFPKVYTSFLQGFPMAKESHEYYSYLMPLAFENFSFDDYDLMISLSSEAAKGIITKPQTLHICYCLTPTRYLWSGYNEYFSEAAFRFISKPVVSYLQTWDKIAGQRPDHYIAISKEVQKRIKTYYNRDSEVVYPPVSLIGKKTIRHKPLANSYFLIVSRLVPYKRIDIAIEAFNSLGWQLKIVGAGSAIGNLRSIAKANITFLGNLTDRELSRYYEGCIALIVPSLEDFGLAALEAQLYGKPVIAFRAGGSLETVIKGKTGVFFYPQKSEALRLALKHFNPKDYDKTSSRKQAENFDKKVFREKFMLSIEELLYSHKRKLRRIG